MASGLVASLVVIAVGAILDFAVTVSPDKHGINVKTVGVVLLIVGIIGAIASVALFGWGSGGIRRHRTMIDDGSGDIVSREDTYQ